MLHIIEKNTVLTKNSFNIKENTNINYNDNNNVTYNDNKKVKKSNLLSNSVMSVYRNELNKHNKSLSVSLINNVKLKKDNKKKLTDIKSVYSKLNQNRSKIYNDNNNLENNIQNKKLDNISVVFDNSLNNIKENNKKNIINNFIKNNIYKEYNESFNLYYNKLQNSVITNNKFASNSINSKLNNNTNLNKEYHPLVTHFENLLNSSSPFRLNSQSLNLNNKNTDSKEILKKNSYRLKIKKSLNNKDNELYNYTNKTNSSIKLPFCIDKNIKKFSNKKLNSVQLQGKLVLLKKKNNNNILDLSRSLKKYENNNQTQNTTITITNKLTTSYNTSKKKPVKITNICVKKRYKTYKVNYIKNYNIKHNFSNLNYHKSIIQDLKFQSKFIEDEITLLFDTLFSLKSMYFSNKELSSIFLTLEHNNKLQINTTLEELIGLLLQIPKLILMEFYDHIEKFIDTNIPDQNKLLDCYVCEENEEFSINLSVFNEIFGYLNNCKDIYLVLVKNINEILLKENNFKKLNQFFNRARCKSSELLYSFENIINNFYFDKNQLDNYLFKNDLNSRQKNNKNKNKIVIDHNKCIKEGYISNSNMLKNRTKKIKEIITENTGFNVKNLVDQRLLCKSTNTICHNIKNNITSYKDYYSNCYNLNEDQKYKSLSIIVSSY